MEPIPWPRLTTMMGPDLETGKRVGKVGFAWLRWDMSLVFRRLWGGAGIRRFAWQYVPRSTRRFVLTHSLSLALCLMLFPFPCCQLVLSCRTCPLRQAFPQLSRVWASRQRMVGKRADMGNLGKADRGGQNSGWERVESGRRLFCPGCRNRGMCRLRSAREEPWPSRGAGPTSPCLSGVGIWRRRTATGQARGFSVAGLVARESFSWEGQVELRYHVKSITGRLLWPTALLSAS